MTPNQYQDLVDTPNENLAVEYKSWLDLVGNIQARADIARHIAAIANHGGGMIVFGFEDDLSCSLPNDIALGQVNRDTISGIVKKYLEPTFHCDVEIVTSSQSTTHPIIIVPSHGATPICTKAGGPEIDGKPRGIAQGTYYTRKPGPESERILTTAEWAPIIRRCALHDRISILSAIEVTIRGRAPAEAPDQTAQLKAWHQSAFSQFLRECDATDAPNDVRENNIQFSYSILRGDGQRLDTYELRDTILLQLNNEVRDRVRSGWSMFYPFSNPPITPRFAVDEESGEGQEDFVEAALIRGSKGLRRSISYDFWRVSPSGKATLIRPYFEDDPDVAAQHNLPAGSVFDPLQHVRDVAEVARHAQAFAAQFDVPVVVSFLLEWRGLAGRTISSPFAYYSTSGNAVTSSRKTTTEAPVSALETNWPEVVTDLVAPILRVFNSSFRITPDWVRSQASAWLR